MKDKDVINHGDRSVHILHTQGHSPGHMSFFEKERRYLFTGELVHPEILVRMRDAFEQLKIEGKLHHGSGTFEYGD